VRLVLPPDSALEAAFVPAIEVFGAAHLLDVVRQFIAHDATLSEQGDGVEGWQRVHSRPAEAFFAVAGSARGARPDAGQARA
jgi:magnesium chelatase family protein